MAKDLVPLRNVPQLGGLDKQLRELAERHPEEIADADRQEPRDAQEMMRQEREDAAWRADGALQELIGALSPPKTPAFKDALAARLRGRPPLVSALAEALVPEERLTPENVALAEQGKPQRGGVTTSMFFAEGRLPSPATASGVIGSSAVFGSGAVGPSGDRWIKSNGEVVGEALSPAAMGSVVPVESPALVGDSLASGVISDVGFMAPRGEPRVGRFLTAEQLGELADERRELSGAEEIDRIQLLTAESGRSLDMAPFMGAELTTAEVLDILGEEARESDDE